MVRSRFLSPTSTRPLIQIKWPIFGRVKPRVHNLKQLVNDNRVQLSAAQLDRLFQVFESRKEQVRLSRANEQAAVARWQSRQSSAISC
jgi:hypothetical protein